ncbi:hypothetical protein NQ318_019304 [Aromia moschata]|uniref:Ribosome-recycling factor, mitochondrial n=1 Tax=Aromia moschata TaxID=1265417 RepID=A0AAV8YD14_9CUCU|nr:hypothetical protein NQ318_019304 [Aromia moschata]
MFPMRSFFITSKLIRHVNSCNFFNTCSVLSSNTIKDGLFLNFNINWNTNTTSIKPLCSTLLSVRHYAKGKDKKKEKGKSKVQINESQISQVVNVETVRIQMQKTVDHLKDEFVKHLSLRSTTGAIEMLPVHFDGKDHTLQELAQVVRKNPKTIVVNMSIFPQAIPSALKSLEKSGMNLNPQQDGTTIYIPIPKVTKEHRENLAKNAKQLFVKCKTGIRDVQMKYVKEIKRKEDMSQDTGRAIETQIVTIADSYIAQAESILENKQKELTGKD